MAQPVLHLEAHIGQAARIVNDTAVHQTCDSAAPFSKTDHDNTIDFNSAIDTATHLSSSTPCLRISSAATQTISMAPTAMFIPERTAHTAHTNLTDQEVIDYGALTNKVFLTVFLLTFSFRYIRTVVAIGTWVFWKRVKLASSPWACSGQDASIIIPTTLKKPSELADCIQRMLDCNPSEIFVVTSNDTAPLARNMCYENGFHDSKVHVIGVGELNKRHQILRALPCIKSRFTILADDDVFWPNSMYLQYLLAVFDDPCVGAGGTRQRVVRNNRPGIVNMLGINYLERRVWNNCASNAIDGSISTLSGRTAAYRTDILKDPEFYEYFVNDEWRGKPLNSDDDKCLTRYVYKKNWKIKIQSDSRAILETTVEPDMKGYNAQCLRWARAHWRGNFTVMENETYWYSLKMWWGLYVIYISQFQTPAVLCESVLAMLLYAAVGGPSVSQNFWIALGCWIFMAKNLKMIPHYCRHPQDMIFIPVLMIFSYYHGMLNIYAACTMTNTHWGNKSLAIDDHPKPDAERRRTIKLVISVRSSAQTRFLSLLIDSQQAASFLDGPIGTVTRAELEADTGMSCLVHDCFERGCVRWAESDASASSEGSSDPPSASGESSLDSSSPTSSDLATERTPLLAPPPTPAEVSAILPGPSSTTRGISPAAVAAFRRAHMRRLSGRLRAGGHPAVVENAPRLGRRRDRYPHGFEFNLAAVETRGNLDPVLATERNQDGAVVLAGDPYIYDGVNTTVDGNIGAATPAEIRRAFASPFGFPGFGGHRTYTAVRESFDVIPPGSGGQRVRRRSSTETIDTSVTVDHEETLRMPTRRSAGLPFGHQSSPATVDTCSTVDYEEAEGGASTPDTD